MNIQSNSKIVELQGLHSKELRKTRKQSAKSSAKSYINKYCDLDNLAELKEIILARVQELKSE
ncbi:hypothetical protein ABD91_05810 [Lysinibacillus sphaericus]|nr:hypothetical protein [Lysinibacillus sphaericus]